MLGLINYQKYICLCPAPWGATTKARTDVATICSMQHSPRSVFIQRFSAFILCKQKQTRCQKAGKCRDPSHIPLAPCSLSFTAATAALPQHPQHPPAVVVVDQLWLQWHSPAPFPVSIAHLPQKCCRRRTTFG